MHAKYETTSDYGALLLSSYPIIRERYYYESIFRTWVKDNIATLCHGPLGSDIEKYGLFVVRQTYATKRCAIASWSKPSQSISLKFQVGASGIADVESYGGWNVESIDGGRLDMHEAAVSYSLGDLDTSR
jgi:hypothetical protein